ncbi:MULTISPECIES: hypothetical protein [unclassified Streptomyces]|uniref:hypothetical protein n=1 Tax=unclassified Streptomyces TaxID=2593676 RepID=UPI0038635E35|nr:hypothetical protein OG569_28660 [Streptomyces sp. NBC_00827]
MAIVDVGYGNVAATDRVRDVTRIQDDYAVAVPDGQPDERPPDGTHHLRRRGIS